MEFFQSFPSLPELLDGPLGVIWDFYLRYWWILTPPALLFIFLDTWRIYIWLRYWRHLKFITLEIKIPKDIEKTPKAMEQVFAGMHAMLDPPHWGEKWWVGRFQEWCSFEMLGTPEGVLDWLDRGREAVVRGFYSLTTPEMHDAWKPDGQ